MALYSKWHDAGREPQQVVLGDVSRAHDGDELRLAFRQGAGLVHHQRGDVFHPFEPHHGPFVLTLYLRTPEMEVQAMTRIA